MTATDTAITACDVGVWIDNAAGTLKDVSGSSNKATLNFDNNLGQFTPFGAQWPKRVECGKDAKIDLEIIYSTAADEGFDIIKNWFFATPSGDRTVRIYVPDKNVGSDMFYGEHKIQNFSFALTGGSADPVVVSVSLLPNGEVSHVVNAT